MKQSERGDRRRVERAPGRDRPQGEVGAPLATRSTAAWMVGAAGLRRWRRGAASIPLPWGEQGDGQRGGEGDRVGAVRWSSAAVECRDRGVP